jgi:hypothetical protein
MIVGIADEVVNTLNGHEFSTAFTAERLYVPLFDLKDLAALRVSVVPKGITIETLARNKSQYDYAIDVAIQKRISSHEPEELDPLLNLVEEIADFFRFHKLPTSGTSRNVQTSLNPIYAPDHLEQKRVFTGVVTLTFRRFA